MTCNPHRNVKNTFGRPPSNGGDSKDNFLNLGLGNWGIDCVPVIATAEQLNNAAAGGLSDVQNVGSGIGLVRDIVTGTVNIKSLVPGAGIGLDSSNPDQVTINFTGGGGGDNFDYLGAQWNAKNGNDIFSGVTINAPKLGIQSAINELAPGGGGVINIEDNGTYGGAWTIPSGVNITINAPSAFLSTTGITLAGGGSILKINSYSFGTNFNNIISSSSCSIYINAEKVRGNFGNGVTNPTQLFINAQEITGDYTFAANLSAIIKFDSLVGSIVDTSGLSTAPNIGILGRTQTGNISSVNSNIYGQLQFSSGSPSITGIRQGYFNGIYYGNQENTGTWFNDGPINGQPLNVINWTVAQTVNLTAANYQTYSNAFILYTGTGGYGRFNLTDDAGIPVGFQVWMMQVNDGNQAGAQATYSANPIISTGTMSAQIAYTRTGGSWIKFVKVSQAPNSQWAAFGDIFNSASLFSSNIFISKVNGTDNASTTGAFDSQFASINAAKAYVIAKYTATPAHGINLFITDDESYNEKLDFTGTSNIYVIGRTAQIVYASSGPGDDGFTSDSPQQFVSVATLSTSGGGKSVNYTGAGGLILNVDLLGNGNVENNGTGEIVVQSYALQGTTVNAGGGQFRYSTIIRSGSDGVGVIGNASDGASGNWTVNKTLAPNGLVIDASSGNMVAAIDSPLLTFTNLSSAGIVPIVSAPTGTAQYKISNILLNGTGATSFSGIGGNRNLHITDGVTEYTLIPAATLQAISNQGWGSVAVPYPAIVAINTATAAGANIYAEYANGTTDYTAGSVYVTIQYERIAY